MPTRPAPSIPTGLSRMVSRRSAPQLPRTESQEQQEQPTPAPRRSAPSIQRQNSLEDNSAQQNVRNVLRTILCVCHWEFD